MIRLWFTYIRWQFIIFGFFFYRLKNRCTYRARHRSWYKGDGKGGFSGVRALTQPALALLVVVPVHGWEGHVSQERGSQASPQRQPALWLHCRADAVSQLPVRLFLRLQLRTDQLQRADHCRWTHWHTQRKQGGEAQNTSSQNHTVAEKNDWNALGENYVSPWWSILYLKRVVHVKKIVFNLINCPF